MNGDWPSDLEAWWHRFWRRCGTRRGHGCAQPILPALSALETARTSSPWRPVPGMRAMINCTISWRVAFGMQLPLEAALLAEADRMVGGNDAWLIDRQP